MRAVLLTLLVTACTQTDASSPFDVQAEPDPSPATAGTPILWTLDITRSDDGAAVEGAVVTVTPWMPAMGHGLTDEVTVDEIGGGTYAAPCTFSMSGVWELQVHVAADGDEGDDVIVVEIE
jgi:hypothetical protein